jgi:hypothetical protein
MILSDKEKLMNQVEETRKAAESLASSPLGLNVSVPEPRSGGQLLLPLLLSSLASGISGNQRFAQGTNQFLEQEQGQRQAAIQRREELTAQESLAKRNALLRLKADEHEQRFEILKQLGNHEQALKELDASIKSHKELEQLRQQGQLTMLDKEHQNRLAEQEQLLAGQKEIAGIRASDTGIPWLDAINTAETLVQRKQAEIGQLLANTKNKQQKQALQTTLDSEIKQIRQAGIIAALERSKGTPGLSQLFSNQLRRAGMPAPEVLKIMQHYYPDEKHEIAAPAGKGKVAPFDMSKVIDKILDRPFHTPEGAPRTSLRDLFRMLAPARPDTSDRLESLLRESR